MGVYDEGWDVLREQRRQGAVAQGLIPADAGMVHMASTLDWAGLNNERRRYEAKRMAVYAGMIEAMDFHIGRLIAYLEAQGVARNTVFIFTSDNGAEASGPDDPGRFPNSVMVANSGYHNDYERLGLRGSYNSIGPSFASAAASPLAFYKFYTGEGGMRVPLIIAGDGLSQAPATTHAFAWATDITPTILSMAGVARPGPRFGGRPVLPISGRDLSPLLNGSTDRVYDEDDVVGYELTGHAALFRGDYKLVRIEPPRGDGEWHLYNIVKDPGEVIDLKDEMPGLFHDLLTAYDDFAADNGVMPLPAGYSQMGQLMSNYLAERLRTGIIVLLLVVLILLPFYVAHRSR